MLCCGLCCLSGCGQKFPDDFPKVYPMTMTVKDGEKPLPNVQILFYPVGGGAYGSSGITNANGVAVISTLQGSFVKKGIPAGEFVVTLADIVVIDDDPPPEKIAEMSRQELGNWANERKKKLEAYQRIVPQVLCQGGDVEERSPIRFTVTEGKNALTVDVAEYKK